MPSNLTRVNLTLPPEVIDVLDRLGKVTGAGRATIIREWLIEGQPLFAEMARAAELAANKNIDALKVMGDVLRSTVAHAEQLELGIKAKRRAAMRKRSIQ
jgi:predicted DNA-binding protein